MATIKRNPSKRKTSIHLTKEEVDSLKEFCDYNLAVGTVILEQTADSGIGLVTKVMVTGLPDTLTDITDISSW